MSVSKYNLETSQHRERTWMDKEEETSCCVTYESLQLINNLLRHFWLGKEDNSKISLNGKW